MGNSVAASSSPYFMERAPEFPSVPANPIVSFHSKDSWNAHWESNRQSNKLVVVDFKASWCGPCRLIQPFVQGLASRFTSAVFLQVDVDELPEVSEKWKVNAMPTFVLMKGGAEVGRVVGAKKDELEAKIARNVGA